VAPAENPQRKGSLKYRFFADPLNPLALVFIASLIAVLPQALNILAGWLGVGSKSVLDALSGMVENATKISAILFGVAFLVFFLRRR